MLPEKVIHRIKKYIIHKNMSMRKFDLSIGASDGYTQSAAKNSASIGSDLIEKIISMYKDLNPYWLMTGEGEMLRGREAENLSLEQDPPEYKKDLFELTLLKYLEKPQVKEKIRKLLNDKEE